VAKLRRAYRGTRSERVDPGQLALLFEALLAEGTAAIAVDPEADAHEEAPSIARSRRRNRPGRPRRSGALVAAAEPGGARLRSADRSIRLTYRSPNGAASTAAAR
jgi:hypothetical protein